MGSNDHVSYYARIKDRAAKRKLTEADPLLLRDSLEGFPEITRLLTTVPNDGPGEAVPGRLGLFVNRGRLTLCVTVPRLKLVAFRNVASLDTVLGELERALAEDSVDWQEEKPKNGKR